MTPVGKENATDGRAIEKVTIVEEEKLVGNTVPFVDTTAVCVPKDEENVTEKITPVVKVNATEEKASQTASLVKEMKVTEKVSPFVQEIDVSSPKEERVLAATAAGVKKNIVTEERN